MFDVLPLSPAREWASSRSFTPPPRCGRTALPTPAAARMDRDDLARLFGHAAAGRRASV